MFPTRFINPIILRKRANAATIGHDMQEATSFIVYIKSGLSRPMYKHRPTIVWNMLESRSFGLGERSVSWMLASLGTYKGGPHRVSKKSADFRC